MQVSKATIEDYEKKYLKYPELFPDFWEFFSRNWHGFLSKTSTFRCSTKI
jgi:hypothetical protein